MRHAHTRLVRLAPLRLCPDALTELSARATEQVERAARRPEAPPAAGAGTTFEVTLAHPTRGALHSYEGADDLLADARTVRDVLGDGGHWRFRASSAGAHITLESRLFELADHRALLRVTGPTPEWADAAAAEMRRTLAPYAGSTLWALTRTRPAMLAFLALPFAVLVALARAGHDALETLLAWTLAAALPFFARSLLTLRAQGAAKIDLAPPVEPTPLAPGEAPPLPPPVQGVLKGDRHGLLVLSHHSSRLSSPDTERSRRALRHPPRANLAAPRDALRAHLSRDPRGDRRAGDGARPRRRASRS